MSAYDERREDDEEGPGHVEPEQDPPTPDEQQETREDDDEQGPGHVPA